MHGYTWGDRTDDRATCAWDKDYTFPHLRSMAQSLKYKSSIVCILIFDVCYGSKMYFSPQNNVKITPIAEDTPPVFGQAADQDKICNLKPGQITFLVSRKSRKTSQSVVISEVWEGTGLENLGRDKSLWPITGLFGPGNKSNIIWWRIILPSEHAVHHWVAKIGEGTAAGETLFPKCLQRGALHFRCVDSKTFNTFLCNNLKSNF